MQAAAQSAIAGSAHSICDIAWPAVDGNLPQCVVTVTVAAASVRRPSCRRADGRTALLVIYFILVYIPAR